MSRCTAWAWPSGDYNNDGFPDILITCVGQNRLFKNTGKGTFRRRHQGQWLGRAAGFQHLRSVVRFRSRRIARSVRLQLCEVVARARCVLQPRRKEQVLLHAGGLPRRHLLAVSQSWATATFEDVTPTSGIFDSSSKSLGVAMLDYDHDGWPDLLVANDTQPNKLYRNQRNGTFKDVAVEAGVAFSAEGKARAGMGVDVADFDNSGVPGVAITNFDNEMIGLYRASDGGNYVDVAAQSGVGLASKDKLGFGCVFLDADLDGALDLAVVNGHIDDTVRNVRGNRLRAAAAAFPERWRREGSATWPLKLAAVSPSPKWGAGWPTAISIATATSTCYHHQQRPRLPVSQRSARGKPEHSLSPGRHEVESRRYWRRGSRFSTATRSNRAW